MRWAGSLAERARRWPGLVPSAFLAGLVWLFVPAQVYEGNAPFFYFPLVQTVLWLVPAFLLTFALLLALTSIGSMRVRRASAAVVGGIAAACWVSATFVTPSHGLLDGRSLLELAPPTAYDLNAVLWVSCVVAWAGVALRFPAAATRFMAAFTLLLALQLAWFAVKDEAPWRPRPDMRHLATLSAQRNVLVILLDAFQADFLPEVLHEDPNLVPSFDGFTWFGSAMGSAMTTYLAMPTIHSGAPVRAGEGIRALYAKDIREDSFMAKLAASGYDAMLVNPILNICPRGVTCDHFDQLVHGQPVHLGSLTIFLESLALFRMVPDVLKPAIYRDGRWLGLGPLNDYAATSNTLLDRLAREVQPGAARPAARFLHLFNSHGPAALDAECRPIHDVTWDRASAIAQDHCALVHVARLMQGLREQGLYDQTAIVLLADHGSGLVKQEQDFQPAAAAAPLLMVKPFGAHQALARSDALVGLEDVGATVCAWTKSCVPANPGRDVMAAEGGPRVFPFITYAWSAKYLGADAVPLDNVYEIAGPPGDVASWRRTTNLPREPVREIRFDPSDPAPTYGFGWSGFEQYEGRSVRWAVGSAADLYVDLDAAHDEQLEFEVLTHPGDEPQQVVVEVNGTPVGSFPVQSHWTRERVMLPRTLIKQGADRIVLRFRHDNPPQGDARRLAVLFNDVRVSPLGPR